MSLDQELKEIEQQCNCPPNADIIAGWNAAKDGNYTPPYNFTRERSRDWVKGNKAYRCRILSLPENLTEKEAYQAGYQSYFSNNGQLVNPCKGKGELEHAFEDGWAQASRKQPSPKFDKTKYQDNGPKSFSEKYSKRGDGYQPSKPKINLYKLMKDGE